MDRAALDAALELGVPCGGWRPKGRRAEDGRVPDCYPLMGTEAEWEYACRAGTKTRFWCGDADAGLKGNANIADASLQKKCPGASWVVGWDDGYAFTSPVGSFKANPWGLYDMHGNVFQWCADGYGLYQEGHIRDPKGSENAGSRVLRGGAWSGNALICRSAVRNGDVPAFGGDSDGFRVVLRLSARIP